MKILYGYPYYKSSAYDDVEQLTFNFLARIRSSGIDIEGFCLTIDPPGERLSFADLDRLWKRGDRKLLSFYESLLQALQGKDVFINSVGMNLHPEFVETLPCVTVFQCFDDPESSHELSKPAAYAYDHCFVGNIAEVETYKSWGVKNVRWRPLGLGPEIYDASLTEIQILEGTRDLDFFMMIDKNYPLRKKRLEFLENEFPTAHFYGAGWKRGFLSSNEQLSFLKRAKIGPNIHNSTGPINYRTFYLPANGVLQICDNKSFLGEIFKLNYEVIGFDSIQECADLCRYYLSHDRERREIAARGWKRAITEYNELAIFQRDVEYLKSSCLKARRSSPEVVLEIKNSRAKSNLCCQLEDSLFNLKKNVRNFRMKLLRKVERILDKSA